MSHRDADTGPASGAPGDSKPGRSPVQPGIPEVSAKGGDETALPLAANEDEAVDAIVRQGPRGAIAVAGIATAIVIGLWFAFYFLVFLPRGVIG